MGAKRAEGIKAADIEAVRAALEKRKRLLSFEALGRTLAYSPYLSRFKLEHFRRGKDEPPYRAARVDSERFMHDVESHLHYITQQEAQAAPYAYVIDICKLLNVSESASESAKPTLQTATSESTTSESAPLANPLEPLSLLRRHSTLPLIHADIFLEEYQILESALFGADLLLLPCSHLDTPTLSKLLNFARRLEMECFVYVRDKDELKRAIFGGANALYLPESALESLLSLIPNTQIIASDSRQGYGVDVEICPFLPFGRGEFRI